MEANWKQQTLGFIFSHNLTQVLLIKKNRPAWQEGKLNGIGGEFDVLKDRIVDILDPGVRFSNAFIREAEEESGLKLAKEKLKFIGWIDIAGKQISVAIYTYRLNNSQVPKQQTDETIKWFDPFRLPLTLCVPDVLFLVPYAKHVLSMDLYSANLSIFYK